MNIALIIFLGFIIGIIFDYLLFRIWHSGAHSSSFKKEEKERKLKEKEERDFLGREGEDFY